MLSCSQFLIACNIPFSLFIMVAIAVDRYLCICRPFTRVLTVHRAKLTVFVLAMCASAVGVCVALMYGVHNQFPPLDALIAASSNWTLVPRYDVTVATGNDSGGSEDAVTSCGGSNCSSQASVVELGVLRVPWVFGSCWVFRVYWVASSVPAVLCVLGVLLVVSLSCASVVELSLLNVGLCHSNELLLDAEFQRRFQYFYYALFTACLLTISVLYALIYCSVLARRSRRHKQKTASLAAMRSSLRPATVFDLHQDNCEELAMTALKVHTDTEARKTISSFYPKSVTGILVSICLKPGRP